MNQISPNEDTQKRWFFHGLPFHDLEPVDWITIKKLTVTQEKRSVKLRLGNDRFYTKFLNQVENPSKLESVSFWYHATTREQAQKIVEEGIELGKSRTNLDFSDGFGFYLTT